MKQKENTLSNLKIVYLLEAWTKNINFSGISSFDLKSSLILLKKLLGIIILMICAFLDLNWCRWI